LGECALPHLGLIVSMLSASRFQHYPFALSFHPFAEPEHHYASVVLSGLNDGGGIHAAGWPQRVGEHVDGRGLSLAHTRPRLRLIH
jgi:hypothetical protein